ncbi:MAG: hypothetical protein P8074_05400 [Anaerolineales bacterium]|jgi:hypothetical protein
MDSNAANPLIITLMFVARCLVPLLIMLGVSYLLKYFGLLQEPPSAPADTADVEEENNTNGGDLAHGKS